MPEDLQGGWQRYEAQVLETRENLAEHVRYRNMAIRAGVCDHPALVVSRVHHVYAQPNKVIALCQRLHECQRASSLSIQRCPEYKVKFGNIAKSVSESLRVLSCSEAICS